jgi:hypothetical protein
MNGDDNKVDQSAVDDIVEEFLTGGLAGGQAAMKKAWKDCKKGEISILDKRWTWTVCCRSVRTRPQRLSQSRASNKWYLTAKHSKIWNHTQFCT